MPENAIGTQQLKIRRWDWLLILGLTLAPMTGLRIWKIGPAEALVFIWCLRYIPRKAIRNSEILRFFMLFLGAMALGTVWGLILVPEEVVLSGWSTWIYMMFVAVGMYEGLRRNELAYNEKLCRTFADVAGVWNLALFILARAGIRSVLGAPLWYYHRYSAGGTNPHQIAIMMCGLTFLFAREFVQHRKMIWNLLMALVSAVILAATESSTAIMALALGLVIEVTVVVNNRMLGRARHTLLILIELVFAALILAVFYRLIYRYAYTWIANDANGLGRLRIFSNIQTTFAQSPIVGLGPGMHSRGSGGQLIEYHNTYLEVLAASGMVGMIALILFTVRLLKKVALDNTFLPVVAALYTYGLAGFAMRRLIYWGIIVFTYTICEQKTIQKGNLAP